MGVKIPAVQSECVPLALVVEAARG